MALQDFNHPVPASDQVIARANEYRGAFYGIQKFWRDRVDISLGVLFAATFTVGMAGKAVFTDENANYRPWFELFGYTAIAIGAMSLSDGIRFAREGEVGSNVMAEMRINAAEDLIQQQSERKFHPYGSPQGQTTVVEVQGEQSPPEPPIEDIGSTVSKSKLPVLVVGSTGSGKTTALESILDGIYRNFPEASVTFFDGKPTAGRGLLGIKETKNYISVAQPYQIPAFYTSMERYGNMLMDADRGGKSGKSFVIVDELNNAQRKARAYMLAEKQKPSNERDSMNYFEALQIANDIVISQGREKNCIGIATTHEATADALGQSSGMRSNNRFVILGSKDSFDNIESILGNTGAKLIVNPDTLARLKEQYNYHKSLLFQSFFALTNVGGDWRLVRLPDYSNGFPEVWKNGSAAGNLQRGFHDGNDFVNAAQIPGNNDTSSVSNGYSHKTYNTSTVSKISQNPPNHPKPGTLATAEALVKTEISEELITQVSEAIGRGDSRTKIIQEVLGMKGRKYQEGSKLLEQIEELLFVAQ